jgi:limonene-1,2-epoxide hydrolase
VSVVHDFASAFNRRDIDALLDCFTATATYDDIFYGRYAGQVGLRTLFERMFRDGTDYAWIFDRVLANQRHAAVEWRFSYTVTQAVPRSAGRRIQLAGMSLFELQNSKIAAYREYVDTGLALLQLGFAPQSLVAALRRRLPPGSESVDRPVE